MYFFLKIKNTSAVRKTVMSQCLFCCFYYFPCSSKICYAVHEIIYTEQLTKLIVFFFRKTVMSQCLFCCFYYLPCSSKICYAVHEIIYTEQLTKLCFCFLVCNVGRISQLWERHSPWISSSLVVNVSCMD